MFDWFEILFYPTENPDITQSLITIMLAIGTGVFLGRLRIKGIALGVSAVMFTSLLLGHYGYRIEKNILVFIRDMGLIFFVYGIGIQLGPSFFSSFKKEGIKLNILAVSTVLLGGIITIILFNLSGLSIENMVGVMSGAVTNTPGLGAAKSTIQEIQILFPHKIFNDPTIAYAITYPFGVLGIICIIIICRMVFKINIQKEKDEYYFKQTGEEEPVIKKKCRVTNKEYFDKTIHHILKELQKENIVISRLKHHGSKDVHSPTLDTHLQDKDVLMVVGLEDEVDAFIHAVGRVSTDLFIESEHDMQIRNIFVTNPEATHKRLSELDLYNKYELKVTRVFRAGREILATPHLELFFGDKLRVVGTKEALDEVVGMIGNSEKKLLEPDFLSLFGGLILGIMLGSIPIFIPSLPVPIKLGFAAGPMVVALLISRYGGISFIHAYINNGSAYFMKDLGISLFFAAVGIHAGEKFYDNFVEYNGWLMMGYGLLITFIPILIMITIARLMKINFLQLAGLISGTYTDPAALTFSTSYLKSDVPLQSYATVYPLVTIVRIFIAQLLLLLFTH